jgi:hypothetical protein
MKFSLAVAIILAGISVSGLAQQTFKVKSSAPEKAARKSAPIGKTASPVATNANSKELQALEHQTAKTSASSGSAAKKTGTGSALKPAKEKPNPPINFGGSGGGKGAGTAKKSGNPYQGRLKQKGRN